MAAIADVRPLPSEAPISPAIRADADNSEFNLLLACCSDPTGEEHAERMRQILSRPLDWERVLALVDHHRVVPQVYGELSRYSHLIPAPRFDALRLRYQNNARKTLWFTAELIRIISHLKLAGIKTLPYKGPVLAETLYGEVTRREFGDLDILILPADVPRAKAALRDLGYEPALELGAGMETAYIKSGYEYSFNVMSRPNLLELQWRIVPRFYSVDFNVADFFDRADEVNFGVCSVRTLCAEDLLLVLCVHAAKHVWIQLSWLCDIARLIDSRSLDWQAIFDEARRLGIERILTLNLLLAHKLLGSPVPYGPLAEDPQTAVLADEILRVIERSSHYDTESIAYFRLMMRLRERWQDRVRFLWRLALTPSVSEWSAVRFPKLLHPLYRLVRLWRVAKRLALADDKHRNTKAEFSGCC
jgi:hypothetical protein